MEWRIGNGDAEYHGMACSVRGKFSNNDEDNSQVMDKSITTTLCKNE